MHDRVINGRSIIQYSQAIERLYSKPGLGLLDGVGQIRVYYNFILS